MGGGGEGGGNLGRQKGLGGRVGGGGGWPEEHPKGTHRNRWMARQAHRARGKRGVL